MDDKTITFIDGDRFLVRQEGHTGYMHLYLYSIRKGLLAQVTKGDWGGDRRGRHRRQTGLVTSRPKPRRCAATCTAYGSTAKTNTA